MIPAAVSAEEDVPCRVKTLVEHDAGLSREPKSSRRYAPYLIDWRFLPDRVLVIKDFFRYHLVRLGDRLASARRLYPFWTALVGYRTRKSLSRAKVLFIHIPKTGGTSISKCLYNRNLPHYTADFYARLFARSTEGLPSFAVIRHPVERLLSAYRFMMQGGTDIMATSRYDRLRLPGLHAFDAFVEALFEDRDRLSLWGALQEQTAFIVDRDGRFIVDRLFSLDHERGFSPELARWLDIASVPHINATMPVAIDLSAVTRDRIAQIYARDFAVYDYLVAHGTAATVRGMMVADCHSYRPAPAQTA